MSRFTVAASELTNAVSVLAEDNNQFRARVSDLMNCAQELASMWQGEANNRFNTALNTDQERWHEFAALIDQYNEALQQIIQVYNNAEESNVSTASTRAY